MKKCCSRPAVLLRATPLVLFSIPVFALPVCALGLLTSGSVHAAPDIDEIVVTARRRNENLQDVPIAVTAIDSEEIEIRGINNLSDVVELDPSVVIDRGFSPEDTRIAIRGLSNTRGRSNVAFLVDGVDVTSESVRSAGSSLLTSQRLLSDVERIEIVKGPQSALYGRSAFAGAISYITRNANLEHTDGAVFLEAGEYDQYEVSGNFSTPLIREELAVGLTGAAWDENGYYKNAASGESMGDSRGYGVALVTNYEPSDELELKWRVEYSDDRTGTPPQFTYHDSGLGSPFNDLVEVPIPESAWETGPNGEATGGPIKTEFNPTTQLYEPVKQVFAPTTLGDAQTWTLDSSTQQPIRIDRQAEASEDPFTGEDYDGSHLKLLRTTLNLNWDIGPGTFTSLTGATTADIRITQDVDYQAIGRPDQILNQFEIDSRNRTKQFSQEFRYATDLDGSINFTTGALAWQETRDLEDRGYIAICASLLDPECIAGGWQALVRAINPQYGDDGFVDAKTLHGSLYELVEWQALDALTLSAEARYVNERFEVELADTLCLLAVSTLPCQSADRQNNSGTVRSQYITPKFGLEYVLADNLLLYASAAEGRKPAGIDTLAGSGTSTIAEIQYDSEKMWNYEGGLKSSFTGDWGRVVLNGTLFFEDYTDKQVSVNRDDPLLGVVRRVENAAGAEIFGQELQLYYQPPIEGLNLSLAYTHLDTEYTSFTDLNSTARSIALAGNCTVVDTASGPRCLLDYSGNSLERAPENALLATTSLIRPLPGLPFDYLLAFDANYQSKRYTTADNFTQLDSVWIANSRVGLQADAWTVLIYVNNLFDNDTILSGGAVSPDFGAGAAIPPAIQVSSQLPAPRQIGLRANIKFGN